MADAVHVPGATKVYIDHNNTAGPTLTPGSGSTFDLLGYTINGVDITHEVFTSDIPGDQNGGDEGPPIEIQYFGQIARVRLEFSKWDKTIAHFVLSRHVNVDYSATGTTQTVGTPLAGSNKTYGLFLKAMTLGADTPLTGNIFFPIAIPRSPIEINKGSKFARLMLEFECHQYNGVLFNEEIPNTLVN